MKKKTVQKVMMILVTGMLLTACGNTEVKTPVETSTLTQETEVSEADTTITEEAVAQEEKVATDAVTLTAENFRVDVLEDGTVQLSQYNGDVEHVVIPEEVNGRKVTVIGADTFMNHEEMLSVVIPDTVVEIESAAFQNCRNLNSIKMSANIEKIGDMCFTAMQVDGIELPESLIEIERSAFCAAGLKVINIPNKLDKIVRGAFMQNEIESVKVPQNITVIEDSAFKSCKKLREVIIEDGVKKIENDAFGNCDVLEIVHISNSVTEMDDPFDRSPNVTIYTPAGSYAEQWALENEVPCVVQ